MKMQILLCVLLILSGLPVADIRSQDVVAEPTTETPKEIVNSIGMKLVLIPSGTFKMGAPNRDEEREVTISRDYYLGSCEVTQAQYQWLMGTNPRSILPQERAKRNPVTGRIVEEGDYSQHPVANVSWHDAMEFCHRLSQLSEEKSLGRTYRLPTQAEWEYACRAGSETNYCYGNDVRWLGEYAWHQRNSGSQAQSVGQKKPNAWGLYDMHGNVWEWCSDWKQERPDNQSQTALLWRLTVAPALANDVDSPSRAVIDPVGPISGSERVYRGGGYGTSAESCTANLRYSKPAELGSVELGFRVAVGGSEPTSDSVAASHYSQIIKTDEERLAANPDNDQVRFRLGVSQFLQTIEFLGQAWYRHGQIDGALSGSLPFLRLEVPENPRPEPITYEQFREIFQQVLQRLETAEATLAQVKSPDVAIELDLTEIKMDWVADPTIDRQDYLLQSIRRIIGNGLPVGPDQRFVIRFDAADVQWLRGYCHLLMAMCEVLLAYDQSDGWDVVARRFFSQAEVSFEFLQEELPLGKNNLDMGFFADVIAGIHQMRFSLREPERMPRVLEHVKQTIRLSREMWKLIEAETDDDREWIPSPRQKPPFPNGVVSEEMIVGWHEFLDEAEAILDGQKLVPFWRGTNPKRGVNIHRVFVEPSDFDVVLWFHGSGAWKYAQDDLPVTSPQTWDRFQRIFRGQFIGFAIWFN